MFLRFILLLTFLPAAWAIHKSHQIMIDQGDLKQDLNKQVRLFHPEFLKLMTFGHDSLSADLLWLQLIQYYGASFQEDVPANHLYSYFDTITSLDPDFEDAYTFSTYLLDGTPDEHQLSLNILEKGRKNLPNEWNIPFKMAFVYYLRFKDVEKAAEYFQMAGELPNAPDLPLRMAAQLYKRTSKLEHCQLSLQLWHNNKEKAPTELIKQKAERSLIETKIICDFLVLREAIQRFAQLEEQKWQKASSASNEQNEEQAPRVKPGNFWPKSLQQLEESNILKKIISNDPLGRPYVYDPQIGSIKVRPLGWKSWELKPEDIAS